VGKRALIELTFQVAILMAYIYSRAAQTKVDGTAKSRQAGGSFVRPPANDPVPKLP